MTRYNSLDFLKGVSIFFIVIIHTIPFYYTNQSISFTINTLARFAVPLFFMISGFFFSKNIIAKKEGYFQKYLKKIILYYIVAALFYAGIDFFSYKNNAISLKNIFIAYTEIVQVLTPITIAWFEQSYHLWFLQALVISIMLLYVFFDKTNIMLLITFILHMTGLFGESYKGIFSLEIPICSAMFFGLFYCFLGHFIAIHEEKIQKIKVSGQIFFALAILFAILQHFEHYILFYYYSCAEYASYFAFTLPFSVCLFLFALKTNIKNFFNDVGKNVFMVYLLHLFVIREIDIYSNIFQLDIKSDFYQTLYAPAAFLFSYLLAKTLLFFYKKAILLMKQ